MENLLVYSVKSAATLSLFWLVYHLFLKRETFFVGHRFFLLFGGLTALFLPVFKLTKYVPYIPQTQSPTVLSNDDMLMSLPSQTTTISWEMLAIFTYVTVVVILFIKLFLEMKALFRLYATSSRRTERGITMVHLTSPQSPFSFFNCIFFHPNTQDKSLSVMLAHEAVHVRQWHSIDVIFGRLISIFLWWFPLSWVYNKEIKQNLEFLADLGAIQKTASVKAYQNVLLETSLGFQHYPLSNYFHKSFLKSRIMMLKTSPSNRFKAWKYSLVFPALYLFVIHFNTKLVAQMAPPMAISAAQTPNPAPQLHLRHEQTTIKSPVFEIKSETTDETLSNYKKKAAENGYSLSFSKIKRNQAGKIIRIRIKYSRNNEETVFFVDGKTPIQPIKIGENRAGDLFVKQGKPKKAPHVMMKKRVNKRKPHASHQRNYVFFSDSDNDSLTVYKWNDKEKPMHIEMEIDESEDSLSHGLQMFFSKNEHALDSLMTIAKFKIQSIDMDLDSLGSGNVIRIEPLEDLAFEELDELVMHMDSIQPKIMKQMRLRKPRLTWIEEDGDSAPLQVKTSGRLIFIDGVESAEEALEALNPDKIEKMEVLKGEMAIEKYGERGKEGVILITTKS